MTTKSDQTGDRLRRFNEQNFQRQQQQKQQEKNKRK